MTERDKIRYVPGVPRWFTRLEHTIRVRRCRREGHASQYICTHCGQFLGKLAEMDDPNADLDAQLRNFDASWRDLR